MQRSPAGSHYWCWQTTRGGNVLRLFRPPGKRLWPAAGKKASDGSMAMVDVLDEEPASYSVSWPGWAWKEARADLEGQLLDLVSCDHLLTRGVAPEDFLYSVIVRVGELYLCGRMEVAEVVDARRATELLGVSPWNASEHAFSRSATPMRFRRRVPMDLVHRLRFETARGPTEPGFLPDGRLERHAFRGVNRLTVESAALLDRFLEGEGEISFT